MDVTPPKDGYVFYLNADVKNPNPSPIDVNDIIDIIRVKVIEYILKVKVNSLCKTEFDFYEAIHYMTKTEGKSLEKALSILFKRHGITNVNPLTVNYLFNIAATLWENTCVAMQRHCVTKFRVHFPGLVVDAQGARDILNKAFKNQAPNLEFAMHHDEALPVPVLGSGKDPWFACDIEGGNVQFTSSNQAVLKDVTPEDLAKFSMMPNSTHAVHKLAPTTHLSFVRRVAPTQFKAKKAKKLKVRFSDIWDSADEDEN